MAKKLKASLYDHLRKSIRSKPKGLLSMVAKSVFANAKTDLGYGKEILEHLNSGDLLQAESICLEGMTLVPRAIRPYALYAEISMRKCDFGEAAKRWKVVEENFPHKAEGYLGEGKALLELHEFSKAENICREGLVSLGYNPHECMGLYYCLIEIFLRQYGRAKDCIKLISEIESKHPNKIAESGFYEAIGRILCFMLGRDKEEINSPDTDFLLVRLLQQPLDFSSDMLGLSVLFSLLVSYQQETEEALKNHLQTLIEKEHIDNPMSVLVSSSSSDDDRVTAYLKIIRGECYHSVQLCCYQPQNVTMLDRACTLVEDDGDWKSFRPEMLFEFARSAVFANQDSGDKFISKIYEQYKDRALSVSDPIGLLCHRYTNRKKFLNSVPAQQGNTKRPKVKLNVAICIGGQLRGYRGNLECLISSLGIDSHNYRVFVHTWNNIGRKFPLATVFAHLPRTFSGEFLKTYYECFVNSNNLQEYIKNQYPFFYALLANSSLATMDLLKTEYKTDDIVIDNEDGEKFSSWDNQMKMHYKIYAAHKLALESGEQFDLIIRIRPDIRVACGNLPDLDEIRTRSDLDFSIYTVNGLHIYMVNRDLKIDDNFAIGVPKAMGIYANTYLDFLEHKQKETYLRTDQYIGHNTLENNLFCNGVHIDKLKCNFGFSFKDPERIPITQIYAALCKDVEDRTPTAEAMRLLEACKKDIEALPKD